MTRFLTATVGALFALIAALYLDFLGSEVVVLTQVIKGTNFVFLVLTVFAVYFFLLFAPMKRKDANSELLLVVATLQFIPIVIVSFAYCYTEVGLKNASERTDYLYFSIVTFTTLGYGDITPTALSKFYAALQALTGFIFVPVLFAQFVTVLRDLKSGESDDSLSVNELGNTFSISPIDRGETVDVAELLELPDDDEPPSDTEDDMNRES
jgi:voltage-gated potassium channel Kch